MKKTLKVLVYICFISLLFGCNAKKVEPNITKPPETENNISQKSNRDIILQNDNTNPERNKLLTEDINYFGNEFPKMHNNPFSIITKEYFQNKINELSLNVSNLTNNEVFIELNKLIALVGDAHTTINYWDGNKYPLKLWIFEGDVYIVNASKNLSETIFSKVLKINGTDINIVIEKLTELISKENESWVSYNIPKYIVSPVYMLALGIIDNEVSTNFTLEKDGLIKDVTIDILSFNENVDFEKSLDKDIFIGQFEKYYDYKYIDEHKSIYFEYNSCSDMKDLKFSDFNNSIFDDIYKRDVKKIIIDLRSNSGGNSEVLKPFTEKLKEYSIKNKDVEVFVLIGRATFSSGMFAIYDIKESVPSSVLVGEYTGGAVDGYGEVVNFSLPNSQIPITYSTKYFELSKHYTYKNSVKNTVIPDIVLIPSINDYINKNDIVLNYALDYKKD